MLPYIFIILGFLGVIFGTIGVIRLVCLPIRRAHKVVYERKDDYLFYENAKGRRVLKGQIKFLLNIYITLIFVGSLMVLAGFYIGFSDHGPEFWLYKTLFSSEEKNYSDRITDDGKFVATDGKIYNYYIMIQGKQIFFKDVLCETHADLESMIQGFDRTNSIVVYDDFAVSSEYHYVIDLLKKTGINPIEDSN